MNFPARILPEFLQIPVTKQNNLVIIIIFIISIIIINPNLTQSQSLSSSPTDDINSNSPDSTTFQPSLAVVIGVLAVMFLLTFLLLIYAKCCHRPSSLHYLNQEHFGGVLPRSVSRVSGIDKTVIESLPFFRFSTLKGWRNGLECSICLSRFEDVEILRLLPKCKHAFHIDCVDKWLEKHSGCPLCRCKVSEEDVTLFAYSSSFRFLNNQSVREGSNLELFIEREGSTRFGSRRSVEKIEELAHDHDHDDDIHDHEMLHKFNHRIIISDYENDLMGKNRWSSLSSSDLLFLKSEMITSLSSNRFDSSSGNNHQVIKIKEEIKRKREVEEKIKKFPGGELGIESSNEANYAKLVEKRSMSEIIVHPRFLGGEESSDYSEIRAKEERLKRLWLPIARRTIQWFANRDDQQQEINIKD